MLIARASLAAAAVAALVDDEQADYLEKT